MWFMLYLRKCWILNQGTSQSSWKMTLKDVYFGTKNFCDPCIVFSQHISFMNFLK